MGMQSSQDPYAEDGEQVVDNLIGNAYRNVKIVADNMASVSKLALAIGNSNMIPNIGIKGDTGSQGPRGFKGDQGERGDPGPQGLKGDRGDAGPRGIQGEKGDTGVKGDKGDTGSQGAASTVPGPKGDKGDTGNTGAKGDKGDTGATGAASTVPGPQGNQGPQGLQGNQGPQGLKGDKGDTGNTGAKGDKGDTGAKGDTGNTGAKGDPGDASAMGTVSGDLVTIPHQVAIGPTPGNVRYEMNANTTGGVAVEDPPLVQIASVDASTVMTLAEFFRFKNDGKAAIIQVGKSRGDGDATSPTMHRKSIKGDRLFGLFTYGSSSFGFSHSLNWLASADYDSDDNNEQATMYHLQTANARTNGNGLQVNSLAQAAFWGPNATAALCGINYGAVLRLGPGGNASGVADLDIPAINFSAGTLTAVAYAGSLEYDGTSFYVTDGNASRKLVAVAPALTLTTLQSSLPGAVSCVMTRRGVDWAEYTLTTGNADYTVAGGFVSAVRQSITAMPSAPAIVGSMTASTDNTNPPPRVVFYATTTTIRVAGIPGEVFRANTTYTFTMMWRLP